MSRIFRKTLLAVVVVFGVSANATALLSAWLLHHHLSVESVAKGRAIAMAIAAASPDALVGGDGASLQSMIDEFLRIDGVGYVFVTDRQGEVVAHTFVPAMPAISPVTRDVRADGQRVEDVVLTDRGEFIQISAPILAGQAGWVGVGMDKAGIWQVMRTAVMQQELLMLFMLAVAVVVFYSLIAGISRPLSELAAYAVRIRDHDFSADPPESGDDEVGVLARAMTSMAADLSRLVSGLRQAVAATTRNLNDALAHTRAIIDNLADGLLVVEDNGRVALQNPALSAMFARTPAEVAAGGLATAFPPSMAELVAAARRDGAMAAAEIQLPGGGMAKAVATRFQLPGQDRAATILLVRDISLEKEVDRMKTEFISTVSHELRTPLTSVLGFAKIIRRKFSSAVAPLLPPEDVRAGRAAAQIRENLDIIVAEGQRLTELVDDVLDIAKMESGRCEWDMAPLSLAEAAEQALRAASPLAARKGLSVRNAIPPDLPRITGDRDRIVQVFVNLIGNAVKFTEHGEIRLEAAVVGESVRIAVRDTGCGIAEADLERVFEKFRQTGDTLTEKPKGTGLGLSICRQIVERHGGRIWAESLLGQGSEFLFTVPLSPPARDDGARDAPSPDPAGLVRKT